MKNKKPIIFLVLLLLIGIVGGTYAYYSYSKSFDNKFEVGNFNVVIEEEYTETTITDNSNISKIVSISNKENTDAVIRISFNEYLEEPLSADVGGDANETNYAIANNLYCNDIAENFISTKTWTEEFENNFTYKDGWYYYNKLLPANESITIMESITINQNCIGLYTKYNLDFNLEAVQATEDAVKEIWGEEITISESSDVNWNF